MIRVYVGDNLNHPQKTIDENTTLRQTFKDAGIEYGSGVITLDGSSIRPGDLDKTFADFGYDGTEGHNKAFLFSVSKMDNAR